jgi:hypothetical protein
MFAKEVHTYDICGFHGLFGSLSIYVEQIMHHKITHGDVVAKLVTSASEGAITE